MKDFKGWLNESVLPTIQKAIDILKDRKDQKALINKIKLVDPYRDKRFAPIIAGWVANLGITPEEHAEDVILFKELHRRLKDLRVPANNKLQAHKVKGLLSMQPSAFMRHYSDLQGWNSVVSALLDPQKGLSDEGLPVVMRHNGYTMYRIDTKEQCEVPLVKNTMGWCVTKRSFGRYDGPPYYPVIRDSDRKPFAMIIPGHFDKNPNQAVRNANNNGRLSSTDLKLIRPLVQRVLPLDRHTHPYIKGVHGIRADLPEKPSAEQAYYIMRDYGMIPEEWEEGEETIAQNAQWAYQYALFLGERFPKGERVISQMAEYAYWYAFVIIDGPWPAGEDAISKHPKWSEKYACDVLRGPFPKGEKAISKHAEHAFRYAKFIIMGRWPEGEEAIAGSAEWACQYATDVIRGPFPEGEAAISKHSYFAKEYAKIKGTSE